LQSKAADIDYGKFVEQNLTLIRSFMCHPNHNIDSHESGHTLLCCLSVTSHFVVLLKCDLDIQQTGL